MENNNNEQKYTKHHTHIFMGICVLFCCGTFLSFLHFYQKETPPPADPVLISKENIISPPPVYQTDVFDKIAVQASAYVVYDISTNKTIASKNKDVIMPLASITKVATAFMAHHYLTQKTIVVRSFDTLPEGESGIKEGSLWEKESLIKYTLLVSSNDGARVLARGVGESLGAQTEKESLAFFLEKLNEDLKKFGYRTLYFYNETGLDESTTLNGGYGSAEEVAHFMARVYSQNPVFFDETYKKESVEQFSEIRRVAQNTNKGADKTSGLLASKTGFTDLAGGNLAVVVDLDYGHPVVIVVLGSTYEGRFSDVETLRQAAFESVQ
jgi:D-alanyl-D-alanine carboxypeptidase